MKARRVRGGHRPCLGAENAIELEYETCGVRTRPAIKAVACKQGGNTWVDPLHSFSGARGTIRRPSLEVRAMNTWPTVESEVRSYCRAFPREFVAARNSLLWDIDGREYIDFLSCAGSLNYGHNHPGIKNAVLRYLENDGPIAALDMYTSAKRSFICAFEEYILKPRNLSYKIQFTNPTGASAIESAVKLARKCTGRSNVIAFTNAFHGMSSAALSLTGSRHHRQAFMLGGVTRLPFEKYMKDEFDSLALLERLLVDPSSGVDLPAAILLETIQGEGGVNVASSEWLQRVRAIATAFDIPLIVDDVQVGCGRSGDFFSWERAGIVPDFVCLAKSISGLGLPMAILLIKEEYDVWKVGEDIGTFRGNNLAFVAATRAITEFWADETLHARVGQLESVMCSVLSDVQERYRELVLDCRGRGLVHGVEFRDPAFAHHLSRRCLDEGLIVETCGPLDQVVKFLPPLTIEDEVLEEGLDRFQRVLEFESAGHADHRAAVV
jgi:diaminobutyrate-2-oxoglutarate transaminase